MEERKAHDQPTKARATNHSLSLAEVYREYADFVWRMARRQGVAACELEDVVHDVFLVVHRRLSDYDGRAGMKTWLFHLTRGVVSNRRRGQHREARRLKLVETSPPEVPATPEVHSERLRAAAFMRGFLAGLAPKRRQLFELVEIEGVKVAQAAKLLKVNPNTAHARLRAARKAFHQAVQAHLQHPRGRQR
ncbi:MAG: RNA polymerase sigma factor [Nannocystaceae bacterium]